MENELFDVICAIVGVWFLDYYIILYAVFSEGGISTKVGFYVLICPLTPFVIGVLMPIWVPTAIVGIIGFGLWLGTKPLIEKFKNLK
jgi:hypothetical protein